MRAFALLSKPLHLLVRAASAVLTLKVTWDRRRLVGQMATFDDHMLRDIGLTRYDLASVLADPLTSDPTCGLAIRAREARVNRRVAALEGRAWASLLGSHVPDVAEDIDRRAA